MNIYKLYKLLGDNAFKISPNYYSKLCATTGMIIFVIKDVLEYLGLLIDKKSHPKRAEKTYNICMEYLTNVENKYTRLLEGLTA